MITRRAVAGLLSLALLTSACPPASAQPVAEGVEFFEKRIRPLLVENCYQCHSTGKKVRGGLLLDRKATLLKGGDTGPAIVPGEIEKSLLLKAVGYKDADLRMPPRSKLPDEKIADLVTWVKMGAPMPDDGAAVATGGDFDIEKRRQHWSFQPIRRPPIPEIRNPQSAIRNPIDAFLLAALEAKGLKAAPEADRRTLIRRLTFDLTGLPPTRAEIDRFLSDDSPDAYEQLVERLLSSPAYGERWARHWLDLVRYAETQGHEFDFELPYAFRYRDYVVRAFNDDLPYDRFMTEHVAGDLLPEPRRHPTTGLNESVLGTGFFFLGEGKHSPVDIRAEGAERSDNQIDVLCKTFLGLTVSCARCHDHKFDPISTKDYYALAGYLRSSRFDTADINPPELTKPTIDAMQQELEKAQVLAIDVAVKRMRGALERLTAEERLRFLTAWPEFAGLKPEAEEGFAERRSTVARKLKEQQAESRKGRLFADFVGPGLCGWVSTGEAFGQRGNRPVDAVVHLDTSFPVDRLLGPGGASSCRYGERLHGALRSPTFTIDGNFILFRTAGSSVRINLIIDGFQLIRNPIYGGLTFGVNHGSDFRWHAIDVSMWVGHRAYIECLDDTDGCMVLDRVVFSDDRNPPPDGPSALLAALADDESLDTPEKFDDRFRELLADTLTRWREGKIDGREQALLINRLLKNDLLQKRSEPLPGEPDLRRRMQEHLQKRSQMEATLPRPTYAMALADGTGENEFVFIRGSHKTLGEEVPRRFLEVLAGKDQPTPAEGSGRLDLARRMIDPTNPLPARVLVNRLWHHHFGAGIVRSPDDFGFQGQPPTHPELLDWLASEFMDRGWSIKAMHRLMLTSSAYRMASRGDANAEEADPENRLLHRYPIRRLEAEVIRDSILAISGRLDRRMEGPGVMPHLTPHMQGRGRPGRSGPIDGDGRRSLYVNVRRNFLTPLFLAFDYPVPFTTIGRRSVSNVPAQALALMNNPFVAQQAELWAKRVLATPNVSPRERLIEVYESAFARPPSDDELTTALDFLKEQGDDLTGWTALCHVLFNVKEFIFLD